MDSAYQALREDHERILSILKASRDSGFEDPIEKCRALHIMLLDHFDREDHVVYSALRDASLDDHRIRELLDQFDDDLLEITVAAKEFFLTCVPDESQKLDHLRDYGTFYILLRDRFSREETILFREYERITH
ncbi:MAG: hypothetical protein KAR83_05600 [Thermodesulfovibrionales bacterium]|nr:hypothetical protein [Thermodesulfovibrionales bacterium]